MEIDGEPLAKLEDTVKRQRTQIKTIMRGYDNMLLDMSVDDIRLLQDEFDIDNFQHEHHVMDDIIEDPEDNFSTKPYRTDVSKIT